MATDFNHHIKQQHLLDQIVNELYENAQRYAPFYQGTKKEMIKKAELCPQDASKVYIDEIVDVIVCATANVVGYNLTIFQNIGGQAIVIFTQCIDKNTTNTLYLKYDYCLGFDGTNHYSAIVMKKPTSPPQASLPHHLKVSLPHHLQASLPHHLQVSLPHHLQASLPHHLQASLPHHLQASNLKNFKNNHLKMKNH